MKQMANKQNKPSDFLTAMAQNTRARQQQYLAENTTPDKPPSVLERIGLAFKSGASRGVSGTLGVFQTATDWMTEKYWNLVGKPEYYEKLKEYNERIKDPEEYKRIKEEEQAELRKRYPNAYVGTGILGRSTLVDPVDLKKQSEQDYARAVEGTSGIGRFALEGLSSIANTGTAAAISGLTGIPFNVVMGIQSGGSAALSAKAKGKTLDQQLLYGGSTGLAVGLISALGGIGASKALAPAKAKVATALLSKLPEGILRWASTTGAKTFWRIVGPGFSEALEEGIEYNIDRLLQKLILDEEVPFDIKEMAYQSLLGGTVGTLFGGVNVGAEALRNRIGNAKQTQTIGTETQTAPNVPPTQPQSTQNDAIAQADIPIPQETKIAQNATESVTEPSIASISEMSKSVASISEMSKEDFKLNPPNGYKYKPSTSITTQEANADTTNGVIYLTDKFFDLSPDLRKRVLAHELNHFKSEALTSNPENTELMQAIWGFTKSNPNTKYFAEKNVDEVVTELLTDYQENPEWLKEKHPQFYAIAENINNGILDVAQYGDLSKYIPTYKQYPNTPDGNSLQILDDLIATNPELAKQKGWDVKAEELRKKVFGEQPQNAQGVQPKQPKLPESVGAMKNKFPHEQKVSEFYTNTLQETDVISDEARAQLDEKDFGFVSVSEAESVAVAQQRLQVDFDGEVEHLSQADTYVAAEDVDTAMGILASYSAEASETDDWSKVKYWAKNVYEKVHQSAVTLQALDKYSRTPEGAVLKAQQEVSKAERSLTTTEVNGKRVKNKRGRDIDKATKDVIDAIEQEAQAAAEVAAQDAIKQLIEEKGNVPVELWGVAIGDALADRLVSNATKKTGTAQPITQTILNDLVKFADEHALPKAKRTTTKRTALDRIRDYYANKSIYTEAWKQAQQQVREMLSDNPEVLDAFDEWVNSTISYNADPMHIDSNMLRAILQASDDIGISKNTIKEMAAFGAIDTVSDRIADHFVQQLGVTGGDAIEVRNAVKRHITEIAREDNAAQRASSVVKSAINELQINISELLTQNRSNKEAAAKAIADYLINRFRVTGAEAESVAKTATETFFDELRRRTEQRLNAILKPHTSKAKKSLLTRITELYNMGAFDNDSIAELVKEKYGIPILTADDVRNIYEYAQLANETTDDYQKRVYLYKAGEIIASKKPSTFRDKVLMVRRLAMLLNPKTLISSNAGGNVIFDVVEIIKDAPGTLIDYLVSLKTGKRSTSLNLYETVKAQAKGVKKGVTEIAKDVKLGVDTSPTRHELPRGHVFRSKLGRGTEDLLNVLMQIGDRPLFEAAYEARMNELQRLGYDTNSKDVQSHVSNYALERVFQNDSKLSKRAAKIRKSLGLLGDITMTFVQTPTNIFDKLLDYSPYGFVRAIKLAGTVSDSVWNQKRFVDTLARAFTGTGVLLFGYFGFLKGFITGSKRDENERVIGAEQRAGVQEYSVVVDGKSYTYDWAAPIGALLAMGANMAQAGVNQEGIVGILTATAKAGIDVMFQQSYLQGLSELFGKENFSEGLQGVLMDLPASFIPTGFRQIARIIDNTQRDTFDKDPVMRVLKKMAVKIPFASKLLPPKIDPTGEEAKHFQGRSTASSVFESFISPGYIGENVQNAVDKELYDLYSRTGDTGVLPKWSLYTSKADLKFSVGGQEYEMTDKEWVQYQKTLGKETYSNADKLIKSPDWRKASDADKSEMIKDIISEATEKAKREIVEARGDMFLNQAGRERVQEYIKAGLNDKQAYELYKKIQALEPKDGKKTVSQEQKLDVILSSNYSAKTKARLVATLYDNSLLHKLDSHSTLLNIYKSTKDTSYINMTVPDKFSKNKMEYVLTDSEKALYEKTFVEFMNKYGKPAPIGSLQAEQARMKKLIGLAKDRARLEVVKSRRK